MPIRRLIDQSNVFRPEDIETLTKAYDAALNTLGITDRNSSAAERVAKMMIEAALAGERDPERLHSEVIREFIAKI